MIISKRAISLLKVSVKTVRSQITKVCEDKSKLAIVKVAKSSTGLSQTKSYQQQAMYHFCESKQQSPNVIHLERMKQQIEKDIRQHYTSFLLIRSSLVHHINHQNYNKNNQTELISVLSLISNYPTFPLDSATMLAIYKIICHNLHLKSVQNMNELLNFVLVADSQASQSPIFHEFLRFYLIVPLQELKFKFQLDFANMSITQAVRQFFGRLIHRGFLSRTPPYERNLNVTDPHKTLLLLRRNESVQSTLMVKKLNYTIFMEIKEFYEKEMKENLYHAKKAKLMKMFTDHFTEVLSEETEMTHHESVHLRELYMKLYLTLPVAEESNTQNLEVFKYRKVIFLYRLAIKHIQSLDHLKIEQVDEKIDIVIQFAQKVEENIMKLLSFQQKQIFALRLDFKEVLLMIFWAKEKKIDPKQCKRLFEYIEPSISCFTCWYHFEYIKEALIYLSNTLSLQNLVKKYDNYSLLSLKQLSEFAESAKNLIRPQNVLALDNILSKVLSTNFQVIGGAEVIAFLLIYHSTVNNLQEMTMKGKDKAESLRRFVMRYIADHHSEFGVRHFEEIVRSLLLLPHEKCGNFDDADGNYPQSVFQEIQPYLSKVSILFSAEVKVALANDSRTQTVLIKDNFQ